MVLKWDGGDLADHPISYPAGYYAAMQHLVKRIAQLRTSHSNLDPSPQSLVIHVTQEAQDVLAQMEQGLIISEAPSTNRNLTGRELTETGLHSPQCLGSLASRLLWQIAQSTHETVHLLEGLVVQICHNGHVWQTGILRLEVVLELHTEGNIYAFDLVTFQPAVPAVPKDCQIRFLQENLLGQSISVGVLLQQLTNQVRTADPTLVPFLDGFAADWLLPRQDWQTGSVRLSLDLEFVPVSEQATVDRSPQLTLKFTQSTWLEQHITNAVEHQLTQILRQHVTPMRPDTPSAEALTAIVQQGCAAIDRLQYSLTLASRTFAQQALSIEALILRLLWGINRTAYEVMQLTSGIRVSLLQPHHNWVTGSLRLVIHLIVRTPEQDRLFDLAQRSPGLNVSPLVQTSIVRSEEHRWCFQPIELGHLEAILWQQVQQGAPEICLLQSGVEVNVSTETTQQLGVIQLKTAFEFTPDIEAKRELAN